MDEAEALADRLVILDQGVVAAEGTFTELLRRHLDTTTISFHLPLDVPADAVGGAVGLEVGLDGQQVEFSSADPQRDLHRLLGWAGDQQVTLAALTVRRSSLEDLFLSIGDRTTDSTGAQR
jgi:ABC-2 type transport system ATP-binding protein